MVAVSEKVHSRAGCSGKCTSSLPRPLVGKQRYHHTQYLPLSMSQKWWTNSLSQTAATGVPHHNEGYSVPHTFARCHPMYSFNASIRFPWKWPREMPSAISIYTGRLYPPTRSFPTLLTHMMLRGMQLIFVTDGLRSERSLLVVNHHSHGPKGGFFASSDHGSVSSCPRARRSITMPTATAAPTVALVAVAAGTAPLWPKMPEGSDSLFGGGVYP